MKAALPKIRLLEAAGFRSFPSTTTRYDGTWAIRMTAGHTAKRLNSVNPLDPADCLDLPERIALAARRFEGFGRPLLFRLTPLAPVKLVELLTEQGWTSFEESAVMEADLAALNLEGIADQLPLKDTGRWVDAHIRLSEADVSIKPGLVEIIDSTEPETGLFLQYDREGTELAAAVRCVRDLRLCGIFDLATNPDMRRRGYGRKTLLTALKWARQKGVSLAWLQVVADNAPAMELYRDIGFREVYRYSYWRPPTDASGRDDADNGNAEGNRDAGGYRRGVNA